MATRMQQRRSPASDWSTANPILAAGELGYEIDTNKFKIGDGINHWSDLSYFDNIDNIGGSLGDYVPLAQKGADNGVATLDSTGNVPFSQLGNIIDGAPGVLDTLNEIANAIGDDASFITTITTSIGTKQDKVSGVSDTEIGYLDGVTSSIQTQLNSKLDSASLTEAAQDAVNSALTAGTGITKTYDDAGNTITVAVDSTIATKTYADGKASDAQSAAQTFATSADSSLHTIITGEIATAKSQAISTAESYTDTAITNLVNAAPSTLDTLKEIADAIAADESTAAALATTVGTKLSSATAAATYAPIASPTFTGTVSGVTKAMVGLGNVDNTSDANKPVSSATQTALDAKLSSATATSTYETITNVALKAPLASPALTGTPTAPTATSGTNTTQISTTAFVKTAIDAITTTGVAEGTNKYFTDQRAVDAIVYSINHGLDVTLDGGTP